MRKILFLMITALAIIGCSNDENEVGERIDGTYFFYTYNSKDSIHCYAVDNEYLYKQERKSSKIVWKKPITAPAPIIKDLGYGEKEVISYRYSSIVLDTDEYIYIYWVAIDKGEYRSNIGLCSIAGEFIKNVDIQLISPSPKFVEMPDKNIIIFGESLNSDFRNIIIDKEINIIKQGVMAPSLRYIKFIDETRYIAYDGSSIILFDFDTQKAIEVDVQAFIDDKYFNESHKPRFEIKDIEIKSGYSIVHVEVTLYSGVIDNIEMKLDNETGVFIE